MTNKLYKIIIVSVFAGFAYLPTSALAACEGTYNPETDLTADAIFGVVCTAWDGDHCIAPEPGFCTWPPAGATCEVNANTLCSNIPEAYCTPAFFNAGCAWVADTEGSTTTTADLEAEMWLEAVPLTLKYFSNAVIALVGISIALILVHWGIKQILDRLKK